MRRTLLLVVVMIALSTSLVACKAQPASDSSAQLRATAWRASEIRYATGLEPALPEPDATIEFGSASAVSGNATVNRYSGTYKVDGRSLTFGPLASTEMAGPEPAMKQEDAFLAALSATVRFRISGTTLELFDAADNVVMRCEPRKAAALVGTDWRCTGILDESRQAFVSVISTSQIDAVFSEDGIVSGSAGVNRYTAAYKAEGPLLSVDEPVASTRMAGPDELMAQETLYLQALALTARYKVEGSELTLFTSDGRRALTYSSLTR